MTWRNSIAILPLLAATACAPEAPMAPRVEGIPAKVAAVRPDHMTLKAQGDYYFVDTDPQENLRAHLRSGDNVTLLRDRKTGQFAAVRLPDGSQIQLD